MVAKKTDSKPPQDGPTVADLPPPRRRRVRRSYLWAALFTAAIGGWMLSGDIIVGGQSDSQASQTPADAPAKAKPPERFKVRVKTFTAALRDAELVIRGRTEADARVEIQAETAGVVKAIPVAKGARVKKGAALCQLEAGARQATLHQAMAGVEQAKLDYEANERLHKRGHTGRLKVAEYKAKLDTAKAELEKAELDMNRTGIKAPFKGIVEDQPAKVGDYLAVGETCAKLVALDPLIIVGHVSEREVGKLELFMKGRAALVTGETVEGSLRYVAPAADPSTRTFRIEIEVANKDNRLRDGVTADIRIPISSERAHRFSPAILVLNDTGQVGVRIVEDGGTVRFKPIRILSDGAGGVWVAGLPESVTVITTGQDYVTDGQKVIAVPAQGAASR